MMRYILQSILLLAGLISAQDVNPYLDHDFYISPTYKQNTENAAANLTARGETDLAAKALKVGAVSTSMWVSDTATIASIPTWLSEAKSIQEKTGKKQIVIIQVYNLPERDCSAKASAGELIAADGGEEKYKIFIDRVAAEFAKYPDVQISAGLETDSTGNMVTNLGVEKCANAEPVYRRCLAYAIANLQLPNVALYLDAAHAGWIGWPGSIGNAATFIGDIVDGAKAINPNVTIRGLQTNVANYNGYGVGPGTRDELLFVTAFAPLLAERGIDAHFIVDQGRSGVPSEGQGWCNWIGAGFGPRPTTDTNSTLVDAIVWIKPGGDSDGTSDRNATRYDTACGEGSALQPAPEAGQWFQAYFEQLIKNANPAF